MAVDKAVILARGLGKRMRRPVRDLKLDSSVEKFAEKGWKAFIPIHGRPLLDYSIDSLRRIGVRQVCLVIGPEHEEIRRYYEELDKRLNDISISFAIQDKPLGTADAVYSAREFVGEDSFIMMNGDNPYQVSAINALLEQADEICYGAGFEKDYLIVNSNLGSERVRSFAVMEVDEELNLVRIVEKPENPQIYRTRYGILVNMNLRRFHTPHLQACKRIKPHPIRKEYEITSAIQQLVDENIIQVRIIPVKARILDLTYKSDIAAVEKILERF